MPNHKIVILDPYLKNNCATDEFLSIISKGLIQT